ncbi:hypothetical protein EJ063_08765 [Vibrio aquaticus]|uniref:Uncharacterized protein n=1 Tax=Vibrio aquaticus TaxID=2496559 RepID=A0A3S0QEN2_9VIBR|nr:hypothetical protein [Vibrio aquaticus]RTZ16868.1 hypothetical protein EJ063_08765 [Vibrio aquaticus]
MEKKVNFGGVYLVQHYSALLLLLLTGSATATTFEQALVDYGNKLEECHAIAKNNNDAFPTTKWFSGLDKQSQKNVLLYLSLDNRSRCSATEKVNLIKAAETAPMQAKKPLLSLLEEKPYDDYIKGLEQEEVVRLQRKFEEPFELLRVGDNLGLLE